MIERLVSFLGTHARLVLIVAVSITITLIVVLTNTVTFRTSIDEFLDPQLAREFHQAQALGLAERSLHVTLEAQPGDSLLEIGPMRQQARMFREISERWPVQIESLATILDTHIARELGPESPYGLEDINNQGTLDNLIFTLYELDPFEFYRLANKSLPDTQVVQYLSEQDIAQALGLGPLAAPKEKPRVNAVRATITLNSGISSTQERQIFTEIRSFTNEFGGSFTVRHYAYELVGADIDARVLRNMPWVVLALFTLLGIVLYRTFRSRLMTLLPLGILGAMIIWSLGLLASAGATTFSFMMMVPIPLLLGQTIDNVIHFQERFREARQALSTKAALREVFKTAGKAALLTTTINMAAFIADALLTNLVPVRWYAVVVVLGIGLSFLLTYIVGSAALLFRYDLAKRHALPSQPTGESGYYRSRLLYSWIKRRPDMIYIGAALVFGMALLSVTQIDTRYTPISFMANNFLTRDAYNFERDQFTLYDSHAVFFEGDVTDNEMITILAKISEALQDQNDVAQYLDRVDIESVATLLKRGPAEPAVATAESEPPLDLALELAQASENQRVSNALTLETNAELYQRLVAHDEQGSPQATVVRFWPAISDSTRIKALADEIDQIALQAVTDVGLKKTLTATTVGEFLVFSRTMDRIVVTAALASIVTFLLIFGVLWAVYRNLVASLLSLLPVLFAAAVGLGALPVLGVELNALNGTVAVLAVGLGIDYSIQMMVRYQEELKKTATPEAAMQETYGRMVWPLGQAALMTTAGLFVLTGLLPITGSFGIAAALALLAAYGAAVLVLPLIAVRWVR